MPLYDYKCAKCGPFEAFRSVDMRDFATCPKCMMVGEKQFSLNLSVRVFEPYWEDNIADHPIYIKNKADLYAACRDHGKYAGGYHD